MLDIQYSSYYWSSMILGKLMHFLIGYNIAHVLLAAGFCFLFFFVSEQFVEANFVDLSSKRRCFLLVF